MRCSTPHVATLRWDLILAPPFLLCVTLDIAFCLSGPQCPPLENGATALTPQDQAERAGIARENPSQTPSTSAGAPEGEILISPAPTGTALPGFDFG